LAADTYLSTTGVLEYVGIAQIVSRISEDGKKTLRSANCAGAETTVTKWSLPPPPGATLISHAISPDGRLLSFTAQDSSGKITLWIRPLSDVRAVVVAGTEGATFPFWSPDSQFVGFFTGEELKKVSAIGGPAQTVCPCHAGRGGSWSRIGVILFSRGSSGVYSVPAGGGDPKPLTQLDASRKEAGHYWPWVLPDGKHFLYTSLSGRPDIHGIWVASLAAPNERRRLVADQFRSAYASGKLLFVRDKLLMAQQADGAGSRLNGDPVAVAEGVFASVGLSSGAAGFSVSDNGVLVLGGVSSGAKKSVLTWFDRTGRRLGTVGGRAEYLCLLLSPDQSRVVVDRPDTEEPTCRGEDFLANSILTMRETRARIRRILLLRRIRGKRLTTGLALYMRSCGAPRHPSSATMRTLRSARRHPFTRPL
jgi:hypothetical protein